MEQRRVLVLEARAREAWRGRRRQDIGCLGEGGRDGSSERRGTLRRSVHRDI